jgi:peroxiredoxin
MYWHLRARQNRELKAGINAQRETIKIGDYFSLGNLQPLRSSYGIDSTSRQLFFVFTTTCPFCKENLQKWGRIRDQVRKSIAMTGISLDSIQKTEDFVEANGLDLLVYCAIDAKSFSKENKISGVPGTILLGQGGRVEKVWMGLLSDEQVMEVVDAISGNLVIHN